MPLDAICINALADELNTALAGAKIEKIQQPARDMVLISLRGAMGAKKLLIKAGTGGARVHLTEQSFENPAEPPMFCMLLRKHLVGARIISCTQPEHERMLIIEAEGRSEMGDASRKTLITEMIGRSTNIILCDGDGRITDCLRRMDFAGDETRRLLPGMIYRMPPKQPKPLIFDMPPEELSLRFSLADSEMSADKWLLNTFSGLSPLVCRELSHLCGGDSTRLEKPVNELLRRVESGEYTPTAVVLDGKPYDYSFMPIMQYGARAELRAYESFSAMLDAFYADRDKSELQRTKSRKLMHDVRQARDRLERKLSAQAEELRRTDAMEDVRKSAELIKANLYRIKKGQGELVCEDYYQPDCPEITITLDRLKTPQQNAAALFKEYNKLRGAKRHLTELTEQGRVQLAYLNSVLDEIERAQNEKDLSDIRAELVQTGYIKKQTRGKPEKLKQHAPLSFISDDGLEILVGRSNLQNDELTTKLARRTDYWLHAQKIHGSHVIIRCDGLTPPERTVEQAAGLAAFYSQGRESGKVPVDYTMVRFVKKPSGAMPGMVVYTDYKTIIAVPTSQI